MTTDSTASEATNEELSSPPRVIGGIGSFALVIGSMLGIGIFIVPPEVAGYIGSPGLFLLLWVVAGFLAFCGATACAELGTLIPKAGGDYVFQKKAYGPSVAFASGWVLFGAIFAGSIATMSVALCKYQFPVLFGIDFENTMVFGEVSLLHVVALGIVLLLTSMNAIGALLSARAQTLLITVPIVLFTLTAVVVIATGSGGVTVGEWNQSLVHVLAMGEQMVGSVSEAQVAGATVTLEHVVKAYLAVYFAYSGWNAVVYVAGEIKNPERNIPRALVGGTITVTVVYVLMCVAFLVVLGVDGLAGSGEAGTATASVLAGETGQLIVTGLIAMALLAGLNGTVMGGARVAFAMGQGGAFLKMVGRLSPRSKAPARALWLQAAWSAVLVLSGSFEQLLALTSLAMLVTGTLTVMSVFVLRRTMPDAPRPYKAFGYPVVPAIYLASSLFVIGVMVHRAFVDQPDSWYPLLGLGILAVAFGSHRAWNLWLRNRRGAFVGTMLAVIVGAGLVLTQLLGDPASANKPEAKEKEAPKTSVQVTEVEESQLISAPAKSTD